METGFRKALSAVTTSDKDALTSALLDFHLLLKTKGALDQFVDGLKSLGVVAAVRAY